MTQEKRACNVGDLNSCNLGHLATVMILVGKRVLLKKTFRRDAPQAFGQLLMKARFTIYLENVASLNVVQHLAGHCELVTEQLSMQKSYISDDLNTLVRRMQSSSPTVEKKKKENGKTNRKRNLSRRNSRSNI